MNTNNNKILKACIKGDREAQYALYQKHKVYLFGVCMRYAPSKDMAEDMLQEGFYSVFKSLKQYSGDYPLRAWMRKVIINSALMYIRKHQKVNYTEWSDDLNESPSFQDNTLFNRDRSESIILLIRQLPMTQQIVFNLKAMDGYSYTEISEKLDIKEATIRSHYLRARTKLQALLQHELH